MSHVIRHWAGRLRLFRLKLGDVLQLEEALKGLPVGSLFKRVAKLDYSIWDIHEALRIGLIGGGMDIIDAQVLLAQHFERTPLSESAGIVADLLLALQDGIEPISDDIPDRSAPEALKFSDLAMVARYCNASPTDFLDLSYAQYVNLMTAVAASDPNAPVSAPTEAEFNEMLVRYRESEGQ